MTNNSNKTNVPEAKEAMDKFKMEVANELGVPLSNGYNGNLTSAQNGSVGGYMVKKMIEAQERQMAGRKSFPPDEMKELPGLSICGPESSFLLDEHNFSDPFFLRRSGSGISQGSHAVNDMIVRNPEFF